VIAKWSMINRCFHHQSFITSLIHWNLAYCFLKKTPTGGWKVTYNLYGYLFYANKNAIQREQGDLRWKEIWVNLKIDDCTEQINNAGAPWSLTFLTKTTLKAAGTSWCSENYPCQAEVDQFSILKLVF